MAAMRALAAEKTRAHRNRLLGQELEAITLHTPSPLADLGRTSALTENFVPVEIEGRLAANQLLRLRLSRFSPEGALRAELVPIVLPSLAASAR